MKSLSLWLWIVPENPPVSLIIFQFVQQLTGFIFPDIALRRSAFLVCSDDLSLNHSTDDMWDSPSANIQGCTASLGNRSSCFLGIFSRLSLFVRTPLLITPQGRVMLRNLKMIFASFTTWKASFWSSSHFSFTRASARKLLRKVKFLGQSPPFLTWPKGRLSLLIPLKTAQTNGRRRSGSRNNTGAVEQLTLNTLSRCLPMPLGGMRMPLNAWEYLRYNSIEGKVFQKR